MELVGTGKFCDDSHAGSRKLVRFPSLDRDRDVALTRESPPQRLVELLARAGVCRDRDWRAAARLTRRLIGDLPAFDSVWLDALAQLGRLTPWQVQELIAGRDPAWNDYWRLRPVDGGGRTDCWEAVGRNQRGRVILRRIDLDQLPVDGVADRLARSLTRWREHEEPGLARCHEVRVEDAAAWFVVDHPGGMTLADLLIRRGRFPVAGVIEILRQALRALAGLHSQGQCHGEIRPRTVRVTERGQVILTDVGLRAALFPEFSLHRPLILEDCQMLAPEIGQGLRGHHPGGDVYSLGCLGWQLLTGRPPYLTADPLAQLAIRGREPIADVRDWSPETPAALAELLAAMTHLDPDRRPSATEALGRLATLSRPAPRQVARLNRINSADGLPTSEAERESRTPRVVAAAVLMACLAAAWYGLTDGQIASSTTPTPPVAAIEAPAPADKSAQAPDIVLTSADVVLAANVDPAIVAEVQEYATNRVKPDISLLPEPDARGHVLLSNDEPYRLRSIEIPGGLVIRGTGDQPARIELDATPSRLTATTILLDHVELIVPPDDSSEPSKSLVELHASGIVFRRVTIRAAETSVGDSAASVVSWHAVPHADPRSGQLRLEDCILRQPGIALTVSGAARRIRSQNVLAQQCGLLLSWSPDDESTSLAVEFEKTTARETGPLVQMPADMAGEVSQPRLTITLTDCVLSPATGRPALVEFVGETLADDWSDMVACEGQDNLLAEEAELFGWRTTALQPIAPLDASLVAVSGLMYDQFEFAGPLTDDPADSRIVKSQAVRSRSGVPGYRLDDDGMLEP
ncbi:MAG: protein kinase [Planctomycetaceae bacterium]|nr:protein kinase [Planctomycetaceae bacterium]